MLAKWLNHRKIGRLSRQKSGILAAPPQGVKPSMRVLGIETSCDETGVALYETGRGILAERLSSQVEIHAAYGGVVPELAARDHIAKLEPLVLEVLREADVDLGGLDGVAYTAGPGLIGALLVGGAFATSLAYALRIPAVPVHHLEGHLLACMLEPERPDFPFLALLVSGGHTQLIEVAGIGRYRIIGETLDDAAGEAFDKVARLLGLPYPGGPQLAALAARARQSGSLSRGPQEPRPRLQLQRAEDCGAACDRGEPRPSRASAMRCGPISRRRFRPPSSTR